MPRVNVTNITINVSPTTKEALVKLASEKGFSQSRTAVSLLEEALVEMGYLNGIQHDPNKVTVFVPKKVMAH